MSKLLAAVWAGARMAAGRLHSRPGLAIAISMVGFGVIGSVAERQQGRDAAVRALQGPVLGLAIPLGTMALVTCALGRSRLDKALNPVALLGASRRAAGAGAVLAVALVAAGLGLATAAASALSVRASGSLADLSESFTAGWMGALTAVAYSFLFAMASGFGQQGRGRILVVVADLLIGPMANPLSALFPRFHAMNLLGASQAAPGWSQPASCLGLCALSALYAAVAARSVRP